MQQNISKDKVGRLKKNILLDTLHVIFINVLIPIDVWEQTEHIWG